MLEVKKLTTMYGNKIGIKDINFQAKEGRILGILGRNGAGKSTLFRTILNILEKASGEIKLDDKDISYDVLDNVGYLIEEGSLTPEYTVYDQFKMYGIIKGMSDEEITESLVKLLEKFNMLEYLNMKIKNISKGNKQKLQFIVALMHNPKLLILDEPFSGLDPVSVEELKKVILEQKEQGKIIVFSSHRMEHVELICDDILLIRKGKTILSGDLNEIKERYNKRKISVVGKIDTKKLKSSNIYNIQNEKIDTYDIYVEGQENIKEVIDELNKNKIQSISISNLSLDDIFKEEAGVAYEEE
ncbi:MAG: ATP-binding cassette domain-containing protein [Clostridia bacterium]